MIKIQPALPVLYILIISVLTHACGGGGGDPNDQNEKGDGNVLTGVFVDSPVSGLGFESETQSGLTNAKGEFTYQNGEMVSFYIGKLLLGSALGAPILSPLSLVPNTNNATNPTVTNITRLLMTLDANDNPDDGIQINDEARVAAQTLTINFAVDFATFESDQNVQALIDAASGTPNTILVAIDSAQQHLTKTLSSWGTLTWGTGNWKSSSTN